MPESEEALRELARFSKALSVPNEVSIDAARIFRSGLERGLGRSKPLARVIAASMYAACREKEYPATLGEIALVSGVDRDDIASCYRLFVRGLGVKVSVADPIKYVPMVAEKLRLDEAVKAEAVKILQRARRAGIVSGTNPICGAASALYIASALEGERLTQKGAAEAAGVGAAALQQMSTRLRRVLTPEEQCR